MRYSLAITLVAAGFAAAQTTTSATGSSSTDSACGAQYILDACLGSEKPKVEACQPNDWRCMCEAQNSVLTCYNNCPGDTGRPSAQNQQIAWCNAAGVSSTTVSAVSGTVSTSIASKTSASSTSTTSAKSQASNAATNAYVPGSGLLAVAVGMAGLL